MHSRLLFFSQTLLHHTCRLRFIFLTTAFLLAKSFGPKHRSPKMAFFNYKSREKLPALPPTCLAGAASWRFLLVLFLAGYPTCCHALQPPRNKKSSGRLPRAAGPRWQIKQPTSTAPEAPITGGELEAVLPVPVAADAPCSGELLEIRTVSGDLVDLGLGGDKGSAPGGPPGRSSKDPESFRSPQKDWRQISLKLLAEGVRDYACGRADVEHDQARGLLQQAEVLTSSTATQVVQDFTLLHGTSQVLRVLLLLKRRRTGSLGLVVQDSSRRAGGEEESWECEVLEVIASPSYRVVPEDGAAVAPPTSATFDASIKQDFSTYFRLDTDKLLGDLVIIDPPSSCHKSSVVSLTLVVKPARRLPLAELLTSLTKNVVDADVLVGRGLLGKWLAMVGEDEVAGNGPRFRDFPHPLERVGSGGLVALLEEFLDSQLASFRNDLINLHGGTSSTSGDFAETYSSDDLAPQVSASSFHNQVLLWNRNLPPGWAAYTVESKAGGGNWHKVERAFRAAIMNKVSRDENHSSGGGLQNWRKRVLVRKHAQTVFQALTVLIAYIPSQEHPEDVGAISVTLTIIRLPDQQGDAVDGWILEQFKITADPRAPGVDRVNSIPFETTRASIMSDQRPAGCDAFAIAGEFLSRQLQVDHGDGVRFFELGLRFLHEVRREDRRTQPGFPWRVR
ncbi:unnamed protein product [Amoebophrya sp. A120]|nr:unnamed protein product [Amoebophrya sp. A120]|eukprot:GSA120T00010028001.1